MKRRTRLVLTLCLCLLSGWVQSLGWSLQPQSRFGFRAVVEGEPFTAEFRRFEVNPVIDRAGMPTGFDVTVHLGGIDSGNADRDREMAAREWFDAAAHPLARFRSTAVERRPDGRFVAAGELIIKGNGRPIEIPFDWRSGDSGVAMHGQIDLDRRWFDVGPPDDSSVDATVSVFFSLGWDAR
jgi:polyisoprenoid-binding protein YceI